MKLHLKLFDAVPARFNVAIMLFFACWVNYMLRVNMSVNIIAMVPESKSSKTVESECKAIANADISLHNDSMAVTKAEPRQPDGVVTFDWTTQEQAYVLSGYFWGYAITSLLSGTAAELWGPRRVVLITMLISAILTILSPQAARLHYMVLVAVRFLIGLAAGFLFPALHALVAHWAPPAEKGKFVSALLGGAIGTVVTWSLTGPLIEKFGWDYAFYVPGIIAAVWCVAWWILVYDSPVQHPRITDKEKAYILGAIGDKVVSSSHTKMVPPFRKIFTSLPFLAMIVLHYGNNWGLYFVMTAAPKYVSSALGFNLTSTGTLSSLPYLARMIFSIIFGAIGDRIVKQNMVSTTFMRKFFCLFSHVLPGLLLIGLGYTGCAPILSVAIITFSMGSNGAATLTNLVNHQDLAPNFAGTLYGIANGIGNTAGFVTPLVTAYFTKHGNGFADWRPVFLTGASLYIISAVYFILFGTGVTQSWNYVEPVEEENKRPSANSNDTTVTVQIKN
ncbi:putative inorganic phosphate cotransporter [Colias croceus]|uniref:putative inorganic phosphate cotransporter n=1 Tax=Colias crocea TaxID=72248 RepID=UPI001E280284|nr:putative inorganic phosphate cotransporter [Colias croceus]